MLRRTVAPLLALAVLVLASCGQTPVAQQPTAPGGARPIQVMASTSIIADVVRQVGGERVAVSTLVPIGGDTHSFSPAPQDIARVTEAQVLFVNGAGYEEFLTSLIASAGGNVELVELSEGIRLRELAEDEAHSHAEGDAHAEGEEHDHEHGLLDPHTWTDPLNLKYWTQSIAETLSRMDEPNASLYAENAARYNQDLDDLDSWISAQFAQVPEEQRLLVTDHAVFGYMADRYGLRQVGTLLPGYSSAAAPSAQELARLQDRITELGVKAIFVGDVVNENLARQIAEDTGVQLVTVLTESLTPTGGVGDTYLDYMRYNVTTIVEALRS